jgi:predicted TIM-barrel fold metal-dependent hydrolase
MIIDGHAHSSGEFFDAEGIIRILDELGVDKVVLCPGPINEARKWPVPDITKVMKKHRLGFHGNGLIRMMARHIPDKHNFRNGNAHVASLAARFPRRIIQAYWIDPGEGQMRRDLDSRHREWKFGCLKVHQCFHDFRCGSPEMIELYEFAGERNLPFFIHLYSKDDARDLAHQASVHPGTTFIIAHLLGLEIFENLGRAVLPNVYFDISPPNFIPEFFVRKALRSFGPGRLVLGSDTPYGKDNLRKNLERIRGMNLPEKDMQMILGGNLGRLLDIGK